DVYKAIKAINPSARVLLSSGYSLDSQAQDIMAQGCGGFIQKPFDLSSLAHKMREVMGGKV
ncbi:MAG: hybrid sensor histidine kinase/response regulator, partial [Pseudomonadota bacterium]